MTNDAQKMLDIGARFPFDATDEWRNSEGVPAPAAVDWPHAAARGILADLTDRAGIGDALDNLDEVVRAGLTRDMAAIIRTTTMTSPTWSLSAAGKIMADLVRTRGVSQELGQLDEGMQAELSYSMVEIIRTAAAGAL